MRADQPLVDAAHRDRRTLVGDALAQCARLRDRIGVEVDVRVVALVEVFGSARHRRHATILPPRPASSATTGTATIVRGRWPSLTTRAVSSAPRAAFIAGLACFQSGEFEAAAQHFSTRSRPGPGRASTLVNLAATQLELARPADALASADAALHAEPDGLDALLHRATALMQLGRYQEAVPAFDRLLAADAGVIEAWFRRGQTLERLGRRGDALASFRRVVALDPTRADAWSGSGTLARELGRLDDAANAFREALRHGADRDLHEYYLASVAGQAAPSTAPRDYVRTLFDDYADSFETHLVAELRYRGHLQLIEGLVALDRGQLPQRARSRLRHRPLRAAAAADGRAADRHRPGAEDGREGRRARRLRRPRSRPTPSTICAAATSATTWSWQPTC